VKRSHNILYDKTCICNLDGTIEITDGSFDHAFGTEKRDHFEVIEFAVYVTVLGYEINITDKFSEKQIDRMKEELLQDFIERQETETGASL